MIEPPSSKPTDERTKISEQAVAEALEMLPSLNTIVLDQDASHEPGSPYEFGAERFDFPYALGFLLAGDHSLSDREVVDLVEHLRVVPDAWRTLIYRGGPDPNARGLVIASRDGSGSFNISRCMGVSAAAVAAEAYRRAAGGPGTGIVRNEINVATQGADLVVEVRRSEGDPKLVLLWWSSDDDDDYSGSVAFAESRFRAESLVAVVPGIETRRTVAVVADASPG